MPKRADIRVRLNSIKRKAKNTTNCTAKRTDKFIVSCILHVHYSTNIVKINGWKFDSVNNDNARWSIFIVMINDHTHATPKKSIW